MRPEASGVILAGGESRRMGRDKLSLEVGGRKIIRRVQNALEGICDEIIVVGSGRSALMKGVRHVPDLRAGRQGPLAGIEAGLSAARHRRVFVAAGDMPFLPGRLVSFLLARLAGGAAVVPRHNGRVHPLCAAYSREILPLVSESLDRGVRSMMAFLEGIEGVIFVERELHRFGNPELFLLNVNTPEDLGRARRAERGLR